MGGTEIEYGYKGKGNTIHLMTEAEGRPVAIIITSAKGSERAQVLPLIAKIEKFFLKNFSILEADKGYYCKWLKMQLAYNNIFPLIPKIGEKQTFYSWVKRMRWKVERTISWLKRGYRRITTRWERYVEAYRGIVLIAISYYWTKKLVG